MFAPYVVSFAILIWLAATGVIMAVFFMAVQIRRPRDDAILRIPSEDAYMCLTYAFVTLMIWVPFRMVTVYTKGLYSCADLGQCGVDVTLYLNDLVLGAMLLIGFFFLSVGLLGKYRRLALTALGVGSIVAITALAYLVFRYHEHVAVLSRHWQFYVGFSIPLITVLLALWYQFSPAVVRFNDFRQDLHLTTPRVSGRR